MINFLHFSTHLNMNLDSTSTEIIIQSSNTCRQRKYVRFGWFCCVSRWFPSLHKIHVSRNPRRFFCELRNDSLKKIRLLSSSFLKQFSLLAHDVAWRLNRRKFCCLFCPRTIVFDVWLKYVNCCFSESGFKVWIKCIRWKHNLSQLISCSTPHRIKKDEWNLWIELFFL